MSNASKHEKTEAEFSREIGAKAERKLKARRKPAPGVWLGLGMMGVIGWSVATPTLLGTAIGAWLDRHYAGRQSWTLTLLVAGLVAGCFAAWRWISREDKKIQDDEKNNRREGGKEKNDHDQ